MAAARKREEWSEVHEIERRWAWVAGIGGGIALIFGWYGFGKPFDAHDCGKVLQAVVLAIWIVAPPIWFWYEYFFLYQPIPETKKPSLDQFKHGQDQAAKIWLALVTVLLGLYFGKDLSRGESSAPVQPQQTQTAPTNFSPMIH
jgi:H+/Cl- antiporter ClcA